MKIKRMKARLLLFFLPVILVILILLTGISYYFSSHALTKDVQDNASTVGTDYGNSIKDRTEYDFVQLEGIAGLPAIKNPGDKQAIVAILASVKERASDFDGIFYINPDGSGFNSDGKETNISKRPFYKKAIDTKKKVLSDPIVGNLSGKLSVVLAIPVLNNNQVVGLITGTVPMEKLSAVMDSVKFLQTGYGQLIDTTGMLIGDPKNPERVGKVNLLGADTSSGADNGQGKTDPQLIALLQNSIKSGAQETGTYYADNVERFGIATPVSMPGGQNWVMLISAPQAEGMASVHQLSLVMLAGSIFCIILAIITVLFIAKLITKPIETLRDECMLLAEGDLTDRQVVINSEDELGQLGNGFEKMKANFHMLINQIKIQTEQLAASSEELTASADQSAQAATQVATSITKVAEGAEEQTNAANKSMSAVQQMSEGLQHVAESSDKVADKSANTAKKADEGSLAVNKTIKQMTNIEKAVNDAGDVVKKLGNSSLQIGQIITTISEIASQTNLLALNAAIEAARAGEAGKGFAVVAEEVRKLAEQSQNAADQISQLIASIQGDIDKAVSSMENGYKEVELGSQVVNEAGSAFAEIMSSVDAVSEQIKEISGAIDEADVKSKAITEAVQRMDALSKSTTEQTQTVSAATQEQSASSESIASASEELAKLASELQASIQKFRV